MKHDIRAIFKTSDSELKKYNGTEVKVGDVLTDEERDPEVGDMYHVTFNDGYTKDAFEDELTFLRYFEVCLEQMDGIRDSYSILIKGVTTPSNEEAEEFIKKDIDKNVFKGVYDVIEWYRDEAEGSFDFSNEDKWPIFGMTA